jgi:hypothetical protein
MSSPKAPFAWTTGTKKLLYIRVDFSDKPGEPISESQVQEIMQKVNAFYAANSGGKIQFTTDVTKVLRMPQTVTWYIASGNPGGKIFNDAHIAARDAGYNVDDYQIEIACCSKIRRKSIGLGAHGRKGITLSDVAHFGTAAHEIGHNLGLFHANLWQTDDGSIIGNGHIIEHGDPFDIMGPGARTDEERAQRDFSAYAKYYLNWLPDDAVQTVTTSGTYRIFAHDLPNSSGLRALTIKKDDTRDYWIEFRQLQKNEYYLMNGALIYWATKSQPGGSTLLDMTPGSPEGVLDAPLFIGRTFTDKEEGIHITPIGKGGTDPESLDIVVNFGKFPDNHAPKVQIIPSVLTVKPNEPVAFKTEASDPDGDKLAYSWDTSDGEVAGNVTSASKSWPTDGTYKVHCIVSDMKGGTGEDTVEINVQ